MIHERIPIEICGKTYEIKGDPAETLYYNAIAKHVEKKMKEIMDETTHVSTPIVAILAALNIADELFQERNKKNDSGKTISKKHEDLIHLLNEALEIPHERRGIPKAAAEEQEFKLEPI